MRLNKQAVNTTALHMWQLFDPLSSGQLVSDS